MKKMSPNQSFSLPGQPRSFAGWLLPRLVQRISPILFKLYGASLRMNVIGDNYLEEVLSGEGALLCTWHGDMVMQVWFMRNKGLAALVSPHWEGELIARAMIPMGYTMIRGSSGIQPLAGLKGVIRSVRAGKATALILDAPEGPRRTINSAIIQIASLTGTPILPCFGAGRPHFQFNSWDRSDWPYPFARYTMSFAPPLKIPRNLDEEEVRTWKNRLRETMENLEMNVLDSLIRSDQSGQERPARSLSPRPPSS